MMTIDNIRRAIRFAGLVLPLSSWPGSLAAQGAAASAFGVAVRTATINQTTPSAFLPTDGTVAQNQTSDFTVGTLVSAQDAFATATSTLGNSNAEGSSLANLVVNGLQVDDPAPNMRLALPGVGYVVLNEQMPTSGGITVNMIHVVLQQPVLGVLGGVIGYRTTGNIIVGSASSGVN